jgi:hypothetical protein
MAGRARFQLTPNDSAASTVVIEPWAMEYAVAAGEECEVVAIHPIVVPTFSTRMANGKLTVRVNECGSTFEFWRSGRMVEAVTIPIPAAGVAIQHPVQDKALSLGSYALYPPVQFEEVTPNQAVLQSTWAANSKTVIAGVLCLIIALVCTGFVVYGVILVLNRPVGIPAGENFVMIGVMGLLAAALFVQMLRIHRQVRRDRGPILFDRSANVVQYGPPAEPETRPLGDIVALQVLVTNMFEISRAMTPVKNSWIQRLLNWTTARAKAYQLNLAFADGSRLNVTNRDRLAPIQELAQQLADFLKVPVTGNASR